MHPPTLPLNSTLLLHPGLTLPTLPCVQEYCYLKCAVMQVANLGVQGIPTGPLAGCPCCAIARSVDIKIDFNFGLSHLSRCASSDVQLEPSRKLAGCCRTPAAALTARQQQRMMRPALISTPCA